MYVYLYYIRCDEVFTTLRSVPSDVHVHVAARGDTCIHTASTNPRYQSPLALKFALNTTTDMANSCYVF